jgi:hypothetical protein
VEQIEEFIAWKGAFEIAYLLESIDDAPYKYEIYAILEYFFDNYKDYNSYIIKYIDRCSPPKEDECHIDECDDPIDSFEMSLFDEIAACDTCAHDTTMNETCKNDFATIIYDNPLFIPTIYMHDDEEICLQNLYDNALDHDKHALCDSYVVEFVHDATENYYERGKYGCRNFHVTKTPLFLLKVLKLLLFYLSMIVSLCFLNLFHYKIPMHRKWVRLKCVSYLLLDALFCFNSYFLREHLLKLLSLS